MKIILKHFRQQQQKKKNVEKLLEKLNRIFLNFHLLSFYFLFFRIQDNCCSVNSSKNRFFFFSARFQNGFNTNLIILWNFFSPFYKENNFAWLVVFFYGESTLFGSFNAELNFKPFSFNVKNISISNSSVKHMYTV